MNRPLLSPPLGTGAMRSPRVRSTVAALLVPLIALWVFAAYVTIAAAVSTSVGNALEDGVARPVNALVTAVQAERLRSCCAADDATGGRPALSRARAETDQARQ